MAFIRTPSFEEDVPRSGNSSGVLMGSSTQEEEEILDGFAIVGERLSYSNVREDFDSHHSSSHQGNNSLGSPLLVAEDASAAREVGLAGILIQPSGASLSPFLNSRNDDLSVRADDLTGSILEDLPSSPSSSLTPEWTTSDTPRLISEEAEVLAAAATGNTRNDQSSHQEDEVMGMRFHRDLATTATKGKKYHLLRQVVMGTAAIVLVGVGVRSWVRRSLQKEPGSILFLEAESPVQAYPIPNDQEPLRDLQLYANLAEYSDSLVASVSKLEVTLEGHTEHDIIQTEVADPKESALRFGGDDNDNDNDNGDWIEAVVSNRFNDTLEHEFAPVQEEFEERDLELTSLQTIPFATLQADAVSGTAWESIRCRTTFLSLAWSWFSGLVAILSIGFACFTFLNESKKKGVTVPKKERNAAITVFDDLHSLLQTSQTQLRRNGRKTGKAATRPLRANYNLSNYDQLSREDIESILRYFGKSAKSGNKMSLIHLLVDCYAAKLKGLTKLQLQALHAVHGIGMSYKTKKADMIQSLVEAAF